MRQIFFILMILVAFQFADAFTLASTDSGLRGWDKKSLVFNLNPTNCPNYIRHDVEQAMALWNSITTANLNIELSSVETSVDTLTATGFGYSEEAIIICENNFGITGDDPNTIGGLANFAVNSRSRIAKAYLILNVQPGATASLTGMSSDVRRTVIAHELGHTIGLGHSADNSALMYFSSGYKTDFSLAEDDVAGYTYLYTRDELAGDHLLAGCARVAGAGPTPRMTALISLLLLLIPLIMLGQRRGKKVRVRVSKRGGSANGR